MFVATKLGLGCTKKRYRLRDLKKFSCGMFCNSRALRRRQKTGVQLRIFITNFPTLTLSLIAHYIPGGYGRPGCSITKC